MKTRVSLYVTVFMLLSLFAATVGCTKAPSDAQISSDIQNKLNADSGLQGKQLGVQAAGGTVTLSGTVDNDNEREAAARYASSTSGVKQVVNNIQVGAPTAQESTSQAPPPVEEAPRETTKPSPTRHHKTHQQSDNSANAQNTQSASSTPAAAPSTSASSEMVQPSTPPPPPPPQKATIPSGTTLAVRLVDPIDTTTAQQGQSFRATLDSPLAVEGDVAIPAGYDVEGHVVATQSASKFAGKSLLTLQLDRISVGEKHYNIQTDQYHKETASRGKNTAEKVGGGAILGAIIGGIAGGGKGAAIGAAAGGGVGGGVQAASKSQQIRLASETVLNFILQAPVTVTVTTQGPHGARHSMDASNESQ
jgi:hypothetical protein